MSVAWRYVVAGLLLVGVSAPLAGLPSPVWFAVCFVGGLCLFVRAWDVHDAGCGFEDTVFGPRHVYGPAKSDVDLWEDEMRGVWEAGAPE